MSYVLVYRNKRVGVDILGVLNTEDEEYVYLDYPHFVRFDPQTQSASMQSYCPLSDQITFRFPKSDAEFVVTAGHEISQKFLNMVDMYELMEPEPDTTQNILESVTKH